MKMFNNKVIPLIVSSFATLSGCTGIGDSEQKEHVKQSIITMVNAIDSKEWDKAESQFAPQVFVDYSSLSGQAGGQVSASDLVGGWQSLLQNVETHHMLSNFDIKIEGNKAEVVSHVYASHNADNFHATHANATQTNPAELGYWDAYGRYNHTLVKQEGKWTISSMTLLMHGQKGNRDFLKEVTAMNQAPNIERVEFLSDGEKVVGNLYLPENFDRTKQYPAVVVSGSWTTVKEQMSGLYAQKLSQQGFIALAFDFRNFGESEGKIPFYENPKQKVVDIKNAVSFLQSNASINHDKIGALGICAGTMYTLIAATEDDRIKSVVTAASWLHDAEAVKMFYGGEEGVSNKIEQAQRAKRHYLTTGEIEYIPSISTTDEKAAMFGPYDYYLNPERGAVPQWSDDKFAVMTWEDWLTLDPMPTAKALTTPTLMIHSDGAVLPDYTKAYFENIASKEKALHWMETDLESPFHQFSFYDQPEEVNQSVEKASAWFNKM